MDYNHVIDILPFTPLPLNRRTNSDRYGFTSLIASELNLSYIPRSFCNWLHGWAWWDNSDASEFAEDLGFVGDPKNISKVVNKEAMRQKLKEAGISNVYTAGLPYAYLFRGVASQLLFNRLPSSILFVPDHSSESNKVFHNIYVYLDYVDAHSKNYSQVSILVYGQDYEFLAPIIKKRGYLPLFGASPECSNSMMRTKALFQMHDFVSTNIMGSHVLYALAAGAKVSICGPYQEKHIESHLADIKAGIYSEHYVARQHYYASLRYLANSKYSHLIVEDPRSGSCRASELNSFVDEELGMASLASSSRLQKMLGWDIRGQAVGYSHGILRRINRSLCLTL